MVHLIMELGVFPRTWAGARVGERKERKDSKDKNLERFVFCFFVF